MPFLANHCHLQISWGLRQLFVEVLLTQTKKTPITVDFSGREVMAVTVYDRCLEISLTAKREMGSADDTLFHF